MNIRYSTRKLQEKSTIKILIKLIRLDKAGYSPSKKFTMATSYEDLLFEYIKETKRYRKEY